LKAVLIAHTAINELGMENEGYQVPSMETNAEADELAEFAGRNCYRSFHRPNPATAPNEKYLGNIQAQQHESVFEHGSATFYVEASRNVLVELERHRFLSFSVVSQRYVDVTGILPQVHLPPLVDTLPPDLAEEAQMIYAQSARDEARRYARLVEIF